MMHLEAPVGLADHNPIAKGYKLKPSIYAGLEVKSNEEGRADAVVYSVPTAFRIWN